MKWNKYKAGRKPIASVSTANTSNRRKTLIFMRYATWLITILLAILGIIEWVGKVNDTIFVFVFLGLIWVVAPCIILWLVGFVMSWSQKDKAWKWLRWGCVATILLLASTCYSPGHRDIADYMAKTYEKHSADMKELVDYTYQACDSNCILRLEWENSRLSSVAYKDALSYEIIQTPGLTPEELATIRKLVRRCNCIGIEIDKSQQTSTILYATNVYNRHSSTILFQRRGFGLYSFILFDEAQLDTVTSTWGIPIRYNDSTFFLFEGGAVGPQDWDAAYRQEKEQKFRNLKKSKRN